MKAKSERMEPSGRATDPMRAGILLRDVGFNYVMGASVD